jgi:hypothetical protein
MIFSDSADDLLFAPINDYRDLVVRVGNQYLLWLGNISEPITATITKTIAEGCSFEYIIEGTVFYGWYSWRDFSKMRVNEEYC